MGASSLDGVEEAHRDVGAVRRRGRRVVLTRSSVTARSATSVDVGSVGSSAAVRQRSQRRQHHPSRRPIQRPNQANSRRRIATACSRRAASSDTRRPEHSQLLTVAFVTSGGHGGNSSSLSRGAAVRNSQGRAGHAGPCSTTPSATCRIDRRRSMAVFWIQRNASGSLRLSCCCRTPLARSTDLRVSRRSCRSETSCSSGPSRRSADSAISIAGTRSAA